MALRIKSHWHKENNKRSLEEIAGALAFIAWKVALDKAINLHGEDFVYQNDEQRIAVIAEYLIFQIQITDRLSCHMLDDPDRRTLIRALALKLTGYIQDNSTELLGEGDFGRVFIDRLNRRSADYSELGFNDEGPSYPFLRHLGYEIQRVMGTGRENRWVIDQVMDRDGPEVARQLTRALTDLFD